MLLDVVATHERGVKKAAPEVYLVNKPLPEVYKPGTPITGQYAGGNMATNLKIFAPSGTFTASAYR